MWEGVGDGTELQYIDPHSYGHNSISFLFSCTAQPGAWGPCLSGIYSHSSIFSPTRLISKLTLFLSSPGYIMIWRPLFFLRASQSHSFDPSTVKVIISWYSSTGCTCYLHRRISYFDSPAGSEVNMQQYILPVANCMFEVRSLQQVVSSKPEFWPKNLWGQIICQVHLYATIYDKWLPKEVISYSVNNNPKQKYRYFAIKLSYNDRIFLDASNLKMAHHKNGTS